MIKGGVRDFVIDLEHCSMMDSTFLGTLTGAALSLRETCGSTLCVLNANEHNEHLLTTLGLDHILDLDREGTRWADERRQVCAELSRCGEGQAAPCKDEQARQVLDAHETLSKLNAANECRFRDVIQFLKDEAAA